MHVRVNLKMLGGLIKLRGDVEVEITAEKILLGIFGVPIRGKIIEAISQELEKAKKLRPKGDVFLDGEKIN